MVLLAACKMMLGNDDITVMKQELERPQIEKAILSLWKWGDREHLWKKGKLRCPYLPKVSTDINENFLRCNPLFLQCLAMEENKKWLPKNIFFPLRYPIFRHEIGRNGYYINYYLTKKRKKKFAVFVPLSCNEKQLPQGIYGLGMLDKKSDWLWDNYDYKIFFDSEYVTNFDVAIWKKQKIKFFSKKLFMPNTDLTFIEMKQYCQSRGKELLNARVFDAAAAFHFRKTKPGDRYDSRSIFPWKGRIRDQFLYVAQHDSLFEFNMNYCQKIYTAECLKRQSFGIMLPRGTSRFGLNNAVGGFLEAVWNKVNPQFNLIPSSFIFSIKSQWHQIGKRVIWNGQRGQKGQIIWKDRYNNYGEFPHDHRLMIAFRCMRLEK